MVQNLKPLHANGISLAPPLYTSKKYLVFLTGPMTGQVFIAGSVSKSVQIIILEPAN